MQHTEPPGPVEAPHMRRERMQRDECRWPAERSAGIELGGDGAMVGLGDLHDTGAALGDGQAAIAGDLRAVAGLRDRVGAGGVTGAVDDQAREALADERGAERPPETVAPTRGTGVPSAVPFA